MKDVLRTEGTRFVDAFSWAILGFAVGVLIGGCIMGVYAALAHINHAERYRVLSQEYNMLTTRYEAVVRRDEKLTGRLTEAQDEVHRVQGDARNAIQGTYERFGGWVEQ